jgi:hypothetical protein
VTDFFNKPEENALNPIQPVSDDFSTDGYLPEFAKVDHQHPLSESLRQAIFNAGVGTYVRKTGDTMSGDLNFVSGVSLKLDSTFTNRIYYFSNLSGMPWMSGPRFIGDTGFSFYTSIQGNDVFGYRGTSPNYFWTSSKNLFGQTPNDSNVLQVVNINGHCNMLGSGQVLWSAYGNNGIWMQDASWVRAQPNFYTGGVCGGNGGLSGGGAGGAMGGYTGIYTAGSAGLLGSNTFGPCYVNGAAGYGAMGIRRDQGTDHTWSMQQLVLMDQGGANSQEGMTFWSSPYGVAPLIRNFGQFGERIDFINSANTDFVPIYAKSFTVATSSIKTKKDIVEQDDEEMLRIASSLKVHKFRYKVSPQTMRPSEKYKATNEKWMAKGKDPLKIKPEDLEHHNHDCAVDFCTGTHAVDDPCIIVKNDKPKYGLIAEHVYDVVPEVTSYDLDHQPNSYDIAQVASIALGGVGALNRKMDVLVERLERLENSG